MIELKSKNETCQQCDAPGSVRVVRVYKRGRLLQMTAHPCTHCHYLNQKQIELLEGVQDD